MTGAWDDFFRGVLYGGLALFLAYQLAYWARRGWEKAGRDIAERQREKAQR